MEFLATTSIESFWDIRKRIVFLSEACRLHKRRPFWSRLESEQLPFLWDSVEKTSEADAHCTALTAKAIGPMTDFLNRYHGLEKESGYYEIVLRTWLDHLIHQVYDRTHALERAFERYPNLTTWRLDPADYYYPLEHSDAVHLACWDDRYNLQLYSQIMTEMELDFPTRRLEDPGPLSHPEHLVWPPHRQRRVTRYFFKLSRWLSSMRGQRAVMVSPYFKYQVCWNYIWFLIKSGFRVQFDEFDQQVSIPLGLDLETRRQRLDLGPGKLASILGGILISQIPRLFLEGFADFRREVLKLDLPKAPLYITRNAAHYNHIFKLYFAEQFGKPDQSRLMILQHGGGEGYDWTNLPEAYERQLADRFGTFGWREGEKTEPVPFPYPARSSLFKWVAHQPPSRRLVTITDAPRYLYRFQFQPCGDMFLLEAVNGLIRFFDAVEDRSPFLVRNWSYLDTEWGVRERLLERAPDLVFDDLSRDFIQQLEQGDMHISHHIGTTFLESMALDVPTLAFLSPRVYRFRPAAELEVGKLRQVGIVHDTPEGAAAHYNAICTDPHVWWSKREVQVARLTFIEQYAWTCKDWYRCWLREIQKQLALAGS
ncbi:MAG: hypothetical protein HQL53_07945 [Magnetococcales bacterium]|nr:hypothetical protein [Magnetococcales bacterium]